MAAEQLSDPVDQPAMPTDEAERQRAETVRSVSLVLVLIGFAALLYAMTLARLIG